MLFFYLFSLPMTSQQRKPLTKQALQDLVNKENFGNFSEIEDLSDEEDNFFASEDVEHIIVGAEEEITFQIMDEDEADHEDEQLPPVFLRKQAKKRKVHGIKLTSSLKCLQKVLLICLPLSL